MKTFTKILLVLFLSANLAYASAFSKDAKFRTLTAHISSEQPLTTGSNKIVIELKKAGKTITNAKVVIKAFMPAMPGMPAMSSKVNAKNLGNGKYGAKLNFAMSGTWQLHIFIIPKTGRKSRIRTTLNF